MSASMLVLAAVVGWSLGFSTLAGLLLFVRQLAKVTDAPSGLRSRASADGEWKPALDQLVDELIVRARFSEWRTL